MFLSNEQLILSDTYAAEIAIMQLLESPYANNRGILAVTVVDKDSLENVEVRGDLKLPVRMLRVAGFRIQVYAGGNSRASRNEAYAIATKIKSYFNDLTAYTLFQSPRWLCRVGDFRTIEEATQMLHKVKETHEFEEATIVKSMIQIPY